MSARALVGVLAIAGAGLFLVPPMLGLASMSAPEWDGLPVGLAVLAAPLLLLLVLPEGRSLARQPLLLAPFGCALLVQWGLRQAAGWWLSLADGWQVRIGSFDANVSVYFVTSILLWTLTACWTTLLLLRVAGGEAAGDALLPSLRAVRGAFWRCLGVLSLGHGVLALPMIFMGELMIRSGSFGIAAMVVVAVAWNFLTATMLLAVLASPSPWPAAVTGAMADSWGHRRAFGLPLLAQLALLGVLVVLPNTFTTNFQWAGGYATGSAWYDCLTIAREGMRIEAIDAWLVAIGFPLAVAIKLRIAGSLRYA